MDQLTSPLLDCRGVRKSFGAMVAVKDVSFAIHKGEVLGIGGPNGAGKTTLFELISGLSPADRGEILFEGQRIEGVPAHSICHLGIARVFQSNAAFDSLTAHHNVLIAAAYGNSSQGLPPLSFDKTIRRRAEEALDFVGYKKPLDAVVRNLPVLDRKLLMIASAIATDPKLLLMDEPVGGLNPEEIDSIMSLVRRLIAEGVTIMLIEHVMRFLVQLSSRVIIMHHGEKIFEGAPQALARDETVKRVYLGESMSRRLATYSAGTTPQQ
jgi:branched-chain amino acid transport system ATP-binding protein